MELAYIQDYWDRDYSLEQVEETFQVQMDIQEYSDRYYNRLQELVGIQEQVDMFYNRLQELIGIQEY
jgi:hypothetical protein